MKQIKISKKEWKKLEKQAIAMRSSYREILHNILDKAINMSNNKNQMINNFNSLIGDEIIKFFEN